MCHHARQRPPASHSRTRDDAGGFFACVRTAARGSRPGAAAATTAVVAEQIAPRFFGALPERGPWTTVGLGRGQFAAILGLSVVLFVFVGGPVWAHVHDHHFVRIAVSYGAIVPATAIALQRNGRARWPLVLGASGVIAAVKLILTAALLVLFALAG